MRRGAASSAGCEPRHAGAWLGLDREESAAPKLVVRPNLPAGSCGAALPVLTCCCLLWPSQGPDSHYGTKGLRKVIHESPTTGAKTCFTFCYAAGNNNGTSVEDGQIPEIIFYT